MSNAEEKFAEGETCEPRRCILAKGGEGYPGIGAATGRGSQPILPPLDGPHNLIQCCSELQGGATVPPPETASAPFIAPDHDADPHRLPGIRVWWIDQALAVPLRPAARARTTTLRIRASTEFLVRA